MPAELGGLTLTSEVPDFPGRAESARIAGTYDRLKPGPGKSQESVTLHQRERIRRAMVELTADRGGSGVTVRALAKLAGVSTATFYALFDGVDDCLLSTSSSVVDDVRERILAQRSYRAPRSIQSDQVVRALFEGLTADPRAGRLALIEAFAGGPAALGVLTTQEQRLERDLRSALSRRGRIASATTVAWVSAGVLSAARGEVSGRDSRRNAAASGRLLDWARACFADPKIDIPSSCQVPARRVEWRRAGSSSEVNAEAATLREAVQKLALSDGYWKLDKSRVSKVAGVPATRFKQHFSDLDAAYLAAMDHLARGLFAPLLTAREGDDWTAGVCWQMKEVVARAQADEPATRLVLSQILAPGIRGVLRKEGLIRDLASGWDSSLPARGRAAGDSMATAVAGLWSSLSRATAVRKPGHLAQTAPTLAYLALAPSVGPMPAAGAVKRSFEGGPNREKALL